MPECQISRSTFLLIDYNMTLDRVENAGLSLKKYTESSVLCTVELESKKFHKGQNHFKKRTKFNF